MIAARTIRGMSGRPFFARYGGSIQYSIPCFVPPNLGTWAVVATLLLLCGAAHGLLASEELGDPVPTAKVECGDLVAEFLDNAQSPQILSGVDRLIHVQDAPGFDAFDPNDPSGSAGLNFEHIISGHSDPANWFAPRNGPYRLFRRAEPDSVLLWRRHEEDPWRWRASQPIR